LARDLECKREMKLAVTLISLVLGARLASAQPSTVQPRAAISHDDDLGPATATLLSLGGTAVTWGMVLGGLSGRETDAKLHLALVGAIGSLVAPSFGHWYARSYWSPGMTARVVSVLGAGIGVALVGSALFREDRDGRAFAGIVLVLGGGLGYAGGTIYDLATTRAATRSPSCRWRTRRSAATGSRSAGGSSGRGLSAQRQPRRGPPRCRRRAPRRGPA
jgi:hypothetical protein